MRPTIFARATAPGIAGVAVIRISGPMAWEAAGRLCGTLPAAGTARVRRLRDAGGALLDEALVIPFEAGASFTGERTVELHCHGGPTVVDAVLTELSADPSLEPADPGAFTRTAFENGRIDLFGAEGLSALLAAETEAQRRQAMALMAGRAAEVAGAWARGIHAALAQLEGMIEFTDDVSDAVLEDVRTNLSTVLDSLRTEAVGLDAAERLSEGFRVAVVGPPNVGKSTLFNYLSGRDMAIVTDIPGTTRDTLEVRLDLGGLPVTLIDTAGLRDAEDAVERIGVERAERAAASADLVVRLTDDGSVVDDPRVIALRGKADLGDGDISGRTGQGVDDLLEEVRKRLSGRVAASSLFPRRRQATAIRDALSHVEAAFVLISTGGAEELASAELWSASTALDRLTGRLEMEDVLDEVFSRFCIGK